MVDEVYSVGSGVAGAYDADYMGCVKVSVSEGEKHCRGIVAFKKPMRVGFVGEIDGAYVVVFNKRDFFLGFPQDVAAVVVGENAPFESEPGRQSGF